MSEYRISQEINLFEIADKYAKRLQEQVDEMTLDKAADALERFGYVKVVRCRDCVNCYFDNSSWMCGEFSFDVGNEDDGEPDGFCAWAAKRKEGGE